jgi:hypothetical protein
MKAGGGRVVAPPCSGCNKQVKVVDDFVGGKNLQNDDLDRGVPARKPSHEEETRTPQRKMEFTSLFL